MADLLRQEIVTAAQTVVVKVGTRVLTHSDGTLNQERIAVCCGQIMLKFAPESETTLTVKQAIQN